MRAANGHFAAIVGTALGLILVLLALGQTGPGAAVGPIRISSVTWSLVWADANNSTGYSLPRTWGSCYNLTGEYNGTRTSCDLVSESPIQYGNHGTPWAVEIGSVSVAPPFSVVSVTPYGYGCLNCQGLYVVLGLPGSSGTYALTGQLYAVLSSP